MLLFTGNVKYTEEIEINSNIDTLTVLFDNPYNMKEYMEGIESYELISGELRETGAKAEITVVMGENKIIMIEEIITNNLPEGKKVTYTTDGVYNIVTNRFVKISNNKTKFINEQEFEFKGYMKVIGFFMPSAFKQQSRVYLKDFKEFSENR
ncbi:MAG: hypothetical protein CMD16_04895 [Flavobacteriales bacterium]|nr:hypothetical protein [Flavobacteriales bacterium]